MYYACQTSAEAGPRRLHGTQFHVPCQQVLARLFSGVPQSVIMNFGSMTRRKVQPKLHDHEGSVASLNSCRISEMPRIAHTSNSRTETRTLSASRPMSPGSLVTTAA